MAVGDSDQEGNRCAQKFHEFPLMWLVILYENLSNIANKYGLHIFMWRQQEAVANYSVKFIFVLHFSFYGVFFRVQNASVIFRLDVSHQVFAY